MTTTATMISTPTVTPTAMPIIIPLSPPPPDTDVVKQMRDHCMPRRRKTNMTSMLDLLTVGPKFRMSRGSSHYRSISAARARPQQQTRRPPLLLSSDGTDRRTDGRTFDRFMRLT